MKNVFEKDVIRENLLTESLQVRRRFKLDVEVKEKYKALTLSIMFFCFAFVGWICEIFWMHLKQGILVNRGTLIGPWLPIYGFSCVFILKLFSSDKCKNITRNPFITFIAVMLLCTVAEYITSSLLEAVYGLRWWDYSNEAFNINGRICLENSILFGAGGCLCLYVVGPALNRVIERIPRKVKICIVSVLLCVFLVDNAYCLIHPHVGVGIAESNIFIQSLNLLKK